MLQKWHAWQRQSSVQAGDPMYNRYIPQPDGSYRRNTVQDPVHAQPPRMTPPPPPEPLPTPPDPYPQKNCTHKKKEQNRPPKQPVHREDVSIGSFFKQLLPRDLDTGDLLVILLLLLMAGDCQEDRNHALLTLVLYLFL